MADNEKNCVLVRDVHGTFYEIPVGMAEDHMLKASDLQSALQHFEGDQAGKQEAVGSWAKMSW
ncbi:hypothetical protein [uncultured Bradyrhizobium sp.]|uniref:hypothetical protein n=1 Tax=uncultured Bradyrhizobium sp. TaxID=199684 RepID=UPI0035C9E0BC